MDEGTLGAVVKQMLTRREGRPTPDGPHEGIPSHLRPQIRRWLLDALLCQSEILNRATMLAVAATCRIPLKNYMADSDLHSTIIKFCDSDPDQYLDVVHAMIQLTQGRCPVDELEQMLGYGGSAWTVTKAGLRRRVAPVAQEAYETASLPDDAASDELMEAWEKAYGRKPDPSDAWDHSIKAVEHILKPVVCPNNAKATLSNVIGDLRSQPQRWELVLPGTNRDFSANRLVAMLESIWPNPDRHGGGIPAVVTPEQAQAVVHLAVTIVQWGRVRVLQRIPSSAALRSDL